MPYAVTFPWLLLNPLAYGYALFRRQLVRVEMAVGHGVRAYLALLNRTRALVKKRCV